VAALGRVNRGSGEESKCPEESCVCTVFRMLAETVELKEVDGFRSCLEMS
jgi:hypothetical protein